MYVYVCTYVLQHLGCHLVTGSNLSNLQRTYVRQEVCETYLKVIIVFNLANFPIFTNKSTCHFSFLFEIC